MAYSQGVLIFAKYAYATTDTQLKRRSEREKNPRVVPHNFT